MTVYFAKIGESRIKIGHSADVDARLKSLRSTYGPVWLLATIPGDTAAERHFQRMFSNRLVNGRDWFEFCPEILAVAEQINAGEIDHATLPRRPPVPASPSLDDRIAQALKDCLAQCLRICLSESGLLLSTAADYAYGKRVPSQEHKDIIEQRIGIPADSWAKGVPLAEMWEALKRRAT